MSGGLFVFLLILYTVYRVLRKRSGTTWLHLLLALGAIASFSLETSSLRLIGIGLGVTLMGIIVLLIEQRRASPGFNQSQGVFTIGVSILLLLATVAGPIINSSLSELTDKVAAGAPETTAMSVALQPTGTSVAAQNAVTAVTNTPAPTVALQPVQVTLPNPLPTRYIFSTSMPTVTVEYVALCQGVVQNNLNLRAHPATDGELLTTIPHSTALQVLGQNEDASWLYVSYEDQSGWINAAYVIQNDDCGDLPVQTS